MSERGSSRRLLTGQSWRLSERAGVIVLEPRMPFLLIAPLSAAGAMWLTAAGLTAYLLGDILGVIDGFVLMGSMLIGIAVSLLDTARRELRAGAWLVWDTVAGHIRLPRLNRSVEAVDVQTLFVSDEPRRVSSWRKPQETLGLGVTTAGRPEVVIFFQSESVKRLTGAPGAETQARLLAQTLASRVALPVERFTEATRCTRCDYDLTGTRAAGRESCPECGEPLSPRPTIRPGGPSR